MNIDLHTLALVVSLINLLQMLALLAQSRLNKAHPALGWWTLGSGLMTLGSIGFSLNILVDDPRLGDIAGVVNNAIFLSALAFIYIGTLRFEDKRENPALLFGFCVFFVLISIYFTFIDNDPLGRWLIFSVSLAVLLLLIAMTFFLYRPRSVLFLSHFLATLFLSAGIFFIIRGLAPFWVRIGGGFTNSFMKTETLLAILIFSVLCTFGLILLTNQRLIVDNRESRENLETIINTSPDSTSVIRLSDGRFVDVNHGFTLISGYTRAETIGRSTVDLNLWEKPEDRLRFDRVFAEGGYYQNEEIVFRRKDGSLIMGLVFAKIINLQGIPHIISVTHDITERKRIENELRKLTNVVEQSQTSVMITDLNGVIEYVNPKFCEVTGYGFEEVRGKTPRILRSVITSSDVYQELWATIKAGRKWQGRFQNRKKNGDLFWESAIISPILDGHGVITQYMAVKEDITEQIQAEEVLLKLAAVDERQRLARNLHDSVNQSIHGMVLFSETLVSTLKKNNMERARQIAERILESARQALKETRLMLYQIQPSSVEKEVDLINDLETRLLTVERHAGVRAHIVQEGSLEHCPQAWQENLFWITIEALNNAMKHAQARNIKISIRSFPRRLDLEIVDDGIGFDAAQPSRGGLGLQNMHERAHLLGGELTILSTIDKGTRVGFGVDIKG